MSSVADMKVKAFLSLAAAVCAMSLQAGFKAGFARLDATPPPGIPMVGGNNLIMADGALDPLCVECIAVSDGKSTALIISVDDLHLSVEVLTRAADAIKAATGLPREAMYIHSTHTHTGPMCWPWSNIDEKTKKLVRDHAYVRIAKLAQVSKLAIADMAGSRIAVGAARCPDVSYIRRFRLKNGLIATNVNPAGPDVVGPAGAADEMVRVIRFMREGRPDIAIVNFGTHPNCVSGTKYSADWPGVVRNTFESGIGGGVKCLFLNAAQGDVNHFPHKSTRGWREMRKRRPRVTHFHIGRAVAGAAMTVWEVCEETPAGPVLACIDNVKLPFHRATPEELKWLKLFDEGRRSEIPLGDYELSLITHPNSLVRNHRTTPTFIHVPVTTLVLGKHLAFVGLPCEPFVNIGRRIKNNSPFGATVITCLTNGNRGYLVDSETYSGGGYEMRKSFFGEAAGDVLISETVRSLKKRKSSLRQR